MDEEQKLTEAPAASVPVKRRLHPWMIITGGTLVALVIAGVVVAVLLTSATTSPSSISKPSANSQATPAPTSVATTRPSPTPTPTETATLAQPGNDDQPRDAPDAPPQAAPPPEALPAPVDQEPPALPAPPAPIITPTITTFTATNFNDSTKTIAQGCAASSNGELAIRIVWATENTTPTIKFRNQISGSPPVDTTITGYGASGQNHYLQLRCSKIAYVTMTLHSENQERQARLTIDGNGPAGWSYLS